MKPAQPGEVADNPLSDGDKKEFVAEEITKETVKTIARGKPGDFRRNRGDFRVLPTNAHGLRVLRAPGFPCSLFSFGGKRTGQPSGNQCREVAELRLRPGGSSKIGVTITGWPLEAGHDNASNWRPPGVFS